MVLVKCCVHVVLTKSVSMPIQEAVSEAAWIHVVSSVHSSANCSTFLSGRPCLRCLVKVVWVHEVV